MFVITNATQTSLVLFWNAPEVNRLVVCFNITNQEKPEGTGLGSVNWLIVIENDLENTEGDTFIKAVLIV